MEHPAGQPPQTAPPAQGKRTGVRVLAVAVIVLVALVAFWRSRAPSRKSPVLAPTPSPTAALDVSGRWQTQYSKTLPGSPPAPVSKEVFLETDREGAILAAGVLLTDPARGGAGAGYRIVQDGPRRVSDAVTLLAANPEGASLAIDFIPFPAWIPPRNRLWRALEGMSRKKETVRYLLLESVEDDYLVQAGLNSSGFLSYGFFSKAYASNRGVDSLSSVIHPEAGSSLYRFAHLVWDLSGEADFLSMEVRATLSGPEGSPDRITLKKSPR